MKKIKLKRIHISIILVIIMLTIRLISPSEKRLQGIVYVSNYIVISILLLMWIMSIQRRIILPKTRALFLCIGILFLYWSFARTMRYTVFYGDIPAMILVWYSYYFPIILIPLFGFYVSVSMDKSEHYNLPTTLKLLLIPAFALIALVFTNNRHSLMFVINRYDMVIREYKYGIIYYVIAFWVSSLILLTLHVLFEKCMLKTRNDKIVLPFIIIIFGVIYTVFYNSNHNHFIVKVLDLNTAFTFFYVAFWEACIYHGLIQSNTLYREFFTYSKQDTSIIDYQGNVRYCSSPLTSPDRKTIDDLILNRTYILKNKRQYNIQSISGGYVIWQEEMSEVIKMLGKLSVINEELKNDISLIQTRMELQSKKVAFEERIRIYDLINTKTKKQINSIKQDILTISNRESNDGEENIDLWKKINFTAIYVKRCSNMILISQDKEQNAPQNFEIHFYETINNLRENGVSCTINNTIDSDISFETVLNIYELIYNFIEPVFFDINQLYIYLSSNKDNYFVKFISDVNAGKLIDLNYFSNLSYNIDTDDDLFIMKVNFNRR